MTAENKPDEQLPPPPDEQLPPEQEPTPALSPADEGSGRFAVYDKDELRFVGSVQESRSAADKLKSARAEGKRRGRYEVREV